MLSNLEIESDVCRQASKLSGWREGWRVSGWASGQEGRWAGICRYVDR
jgi:hypothetical protein